MQIILKKFVACLMLAGSISIPMSARASQLDNALDGMFSNLTGAGVAKTPDRTAFIGGGLTLRGPVQNLNIITFDPPRLSAGCGGLDIFGGSFSFINADQIVALFRKVAANAIGLAFQAAIDAINPQLGQLMSDFQTIMEALNIGNKNSCSLAISLMGKIGADTAIKDTVSGWVAGTGSALSGIAEDVTKGITNVAESLSAATKESEKIVAISGNAVWKAINNPNTANGEGLGLLFSDPSASSAGASAAKNANEIIMSLTGYFVVKTDNKGTSSSGAELTNGALAQATYLISIDDLRKGGTFQKFKCAEPYKDDTDGGCLNVGTESFTFIGMKGYVKDLLLGGDTTAVDLVAAYAAQPPALSAKQDMLLKTSQMPIAALLQRVGFSQSAQTQVLQQIAPIVAEGLLYQYVSSLSKILRNIEHNPTASIPPFVSARIKDFNDETATLATKQIDWLRQLNDVTKFTDEVRRGNYATFYTIAGGK